MKIVEIVESKVWKNKLTGDTASIYGSVPYTRDTDAVNWQIVTRGYTWRLDNGTVGLGRVPAKTLEEATKVMEKFNNKD